MNKTIDWTLTPIHKKIFMAWGKITGWLSLTKAHRNLMNEMQIRITRKKAWFCCRQKRKAGIIGKVHPAAGVPAIPFN